MTPKEELELSIELIKAVAWPGVTLIGLLLYRSELKAMIRRVKSGKFFGQEVSLGEDLERLESKTTAAETAVGPRGLGDGVARVGPRDEVLGTLASSMPIGALVQLSARIEQQAREILVCAGKLSAKRVLSLTPMIAILRRANAIPEEVAQSLEQFTEVRNKIVHGHDVPQADVERTVASGLRLLEVLANVPRGVHVVRLVGIPLYSDSEGKLPRAGVTGVQIETAQRPGATAGILQVLPTRRSFQTGQIVSWEWDADQSYGETWYRHPETNALEPAWKGSREFVGQPLEDSREAAA